MLAGNIAALGGAIAGRNLKLTNCTIAGNRAAQNPEICASGNGSSQLFNCIVWKNEKVPPQDQTVTDWLGACSYCCIDPNAIASRVIGNIERDPAFAMPGYWDPNSTPEDPNDDFWVAGDYHLKSLAGRWDPNSQRWVMDDVSSPCIDAGDPNSPVGDEPEPNGGRINMGAYGGTAEASKSRLPKTFNERLQDLLATAEGQPKGQPMIRKRQNYISFILPPAGTHFGVDPDYRSPAEKAANWFLYQWRDLFVNSSNAVSFEVSRVGTFGAFYQQKYAGLEVYGAQLHINVGQDGRIESVTSGIQVDTSVLDTGKVSLTPSLDGAMAQSKAIGFFAAQYGWTVTETSPPILMIYGPLVLSEKGEIRLVWKMETYGASPRMNQEVLVDAHSGEIVRHVSLIAVR